MNRIVDFPLLVLVLSLVGLWLSAKIGGSIRKRRQNVEEGREDFDVIRAAILTLLALIIGFSFSVAVNRYDQRKNFEAAEANAIGTEYVRADLLPAADGARVRPLLRNYLDQRVLFYNTRDNRQLQQIKATTAQLEADLWAVVQAPVLAQPTPGVALAASGMNDVLNSQGSTQAAWLYRLPGGGMDPDGSNRHLLQLNDRLWFTPRWSERHPFPPATACCVLLVFSHRRH